MIYDAPRWLPGGHAQTIYPSVLPHFLRGMVPLVYQRTRLDTPDGDFVDVDWVKPSGSPQTHRLLVLFHGLEGSSRSHYARAFAGVFSRQGWQVALPNFRGCSGEPNRLIRAYHSGDSAEIAWLLDQVALVSRARHIVALGVSLGGNALLKHVGECGAGLARLTPGLMACAAISAPMDLAACGHALDHGINRFYMQRFLQTLKPKAAAKALRFPDQLDTSAIEKANSLYSYDNAFTAPVHGYANTDAYWCNASSKPWLQHIQLPTLIVNARNDPFIPENSLPSADEVSSKVDLWQPREGGHAGFVGGVFPGHLTILPQAVLSWFADSNQV